MTGSLRDKRGIWQVIIRYKDSNGNWKNTEKSTGLRVKDNTKREATQIMNTMLAKFRENQAVFTDKILFADFLDVWLQHVYNTRDEADLGLITVEGYEQTIRNHLYPYFQEKKLQPCDITVDVILSYYEDKMANGRLCEKGGLSSRSIRQHHTVIRQALDFAVRKGLILSNPARCVRLPRIEKTKPSFYAKEEVNQFLSCCQEGDPIQIIVMLSAFYGLRRSEVMALRWQSIDFNKNTLSIDHTVSARKTTVYKNNGKSESSIREYPLIPEIKALLLELKTKQENNRQSLEDRYNESYSMYVFVWENGTRIHHDYPSKKFSKIIEKNGLRKIRFHDLRHSTCSNMHSDGILLDDTKNWVGHADVSTTSNYYTHVDTERKNSIANIYKNGFDFSACKV